MGLFNLMPIPYKTNVLGNNNRFSEPWTKFIIKLFERVKVLQREFILLDVSRSESTNLTTGTGKYSFSLPFAFQLISITGIVATAPTGDTIIIDANVDGSTILSTKLSIDIGEKTSETAATPAVISSPSINRNSVISFDIDQIGSSTAGAGLKLLILGSRI